MRVLGIDPGSRFTGYGVVEERAGQLRHLGHGVIHADESAPLERRLTQIFAELTLALGLYAPDVVAVEGLFTFKNARSALVLGHARGVALLCAAQKGLAVHEYPPARVKRSVGAGGADGKGAVARMVEAFLKLPALKPADASDALAVAICHLNHARVGAGLSSASGRGGKLRKGTRDGFGALAGRLSPSYQRFGKTGLTG